MKKVLKLVLVFGIALNSVQAKADCRPTYQTYIDSIKTIKSASVSTSTIQSGIMLSSNFISEESRVGIIINKLMNKRVYWLILGVSAAAALLTQLTPEEVRVKNLIDEAYLNKGPHLTHLAERTGLSVDKLSQTIISLNESDALCTKAIGTPPTSAVTIELKGEKDLIALIQAHSLVH